MTIECGLDTESAEHKRAVTTAFDEKAKELDATYEDRSVALEAREQDLDKRRRELDDRGARHARREQSRELQQKISERSKKFTLTPDTEAQTTIDTRDICRSSPCVGRSDCSLATVSRNDSGRPSVVVRTRTVALRCVGIRFNVGVLHPLERSSGLVSMPTKSSGFNSLPLMLIELVTL